jgi:DHA1 family tetracycline resistance protein-like MFS transporter
LSNWLYGVFVLPESLSAERRVKSFDWRRANPLGALAFLRSRGNLLGLASVGFLFQLSQNVLPTIFVLYTGYRYGWTPNILGFTFMATGVAGIIVQMFLVGPVVKRVGERGAVLLGACAGATGFLIFAFASRGWIYLVGLPVFAAVGFIQPGLMGLMSRRVDPSHQGQLQGANQSLQGISSVIGPPLFGLTFAWSIRHDTGLHLPGLAILISAALLCAAFLISLRVARPVGGPAPAG